MRRTVRLREALGSENGRRSEPAGGPEDCGKKRVQSRSKCYNDSVFVGCAETTPYCKSDFKNKSFSAKHRSNFKSTLHYVIVQGISCNLQM